MTTFAEAEVEQAALEWLEGRAGGRLTGPDIGPDGPNAEGLDLGHVVLECRLRDALLPRLVSGEIRVGM